LFIKSNFWTRFGTRFGQAGLVSGLVSMYNCGNHLGYIGLIKQYRITYWRRNRYWQRFRDVRS